MQTSQILLQQSGETSGFLHGGVGGIETVKKPTQINLSYRNNTRPKAHKHMFSGMSTFLWPYGANYMYFY